MRFDPEFYLNYPRNNNEDLIIRNIDPYCHWTTTGRRLGKVGTPYPINTITKVCVIIHLYDEELLNEFLEYVENVRFVFSNTTVIFTLNINSKLDKKIGEINKDFVVIKVENKGVDIYPFFESIKYIRTNNLKIDYILKLHTKSTNNKWEGLDDWRKQLILPIVKYNNLCHLQYYFKTMKNIGYVAAQSCIFPKVYDESDALMCNIKGVNDTISLFPHLEKDWTDFVAGTMFWISYSVIDKYLTDELMAHGTSLVSYGKPQVNESSILAPIEYIFERMLTGVFCYDKTNITVSGYSIPLLPRNPDRLVVYPSGDQYFHNPRVFSFHRPKLFNTHGFSYYDRTTDNP